MLDAISPSARFSTFLDYTFCHCCEYRFIYHCYLREHADLSCSSEFSPSSSIQAVVSLFGINRPLCWTNISQPCFVIYLTSEIMQALSVCHVAQRLLHISSTILCGISLCTLTAISVDRLLALLLGLRYRQVVTLARVRGMAILSWVMFFSLSVLYFWNPYVPMITLCVIVLLCLVASTFSYSRIYFTLRYQQPLVFPEHGEMQNMSAQARVLKFRKTVSSSLWVYLTLIACYLPFAIVQMVAATNGDSLSIILAEGSTTSLVYLNSSINPVIYCWRIREVWQAVKATIRRFCSSCF